MDVNERRMNKRRFTLELIQNDPRESRRRVKCPRGLVSVLSLLDASHLQYLARAIYDDLVYRSKKLY